MTLRDRDCGFSLIEAVAALLVLALFLLLMSSMGGLVTKTRDAATRKADAVEQLATGLALMRREIATARWMEAEMGGERAVLFSGDRSHIAFVASTGGSTPDMRVGYYVKPVANGSAIFRVAAMLTVDTHGGSWGAPQEVLRRPGHFDFSFARQAGPTGLAWSAEWPPHSPVLPVAVKMQLSGSAATSGMDFIIVMRGNDPPPCRNESCLNQAAQLAAKE